MAHISLQAEKCRMIIKNGKIRFQAMRYDLNGEEIDKVTVTLPMCEFYKFGNIVNLDEERNIVDESRNRLEDFLSE